MGGNEYGIVFVIAVGIRSNVFISIALSPQTCRLSYKECPSDVMDGGTSGGEVEFEDPFTVAGEASRLNFKTTISPSAELGKPDEGLVNGRIIHAVHEEKKQESNRCHEDRRVLPSVLSLLLSSSQNLSFFIAVTLSGMGSGVIDTFLFIR